MQARREWTEICNVLKEKNTKLEFHMQKNYPLKLKEKFLRENLGDFSSSRPALQEMLKEDIQEGGNYIGQ